MTFLGSDLNRVTFKSDPAWVWMADPSRIGSRRSYVKATIRQANLGLNPSGSSPGTTASNLSIHQLTSFKCVNVL